MPLGLWSRRLHWLLKVLSKPPSLFSKRGRLFICDYSKTGRSSTFRRWSFIIINKGCYLPEIMQVNISHHQILKGRRTNLAALSHIAGYTGKRHPPPQQPYNNEQRNLNDQEECRRNSIYAFLAHMTAGCVNRARPLT